MTSVVFILSVGFLLGLRHALDADHVVAVATIVSKGKRWGTAWFLGLCWGVGHTLTLFLVGVAILIFKITVTLTLQLSLEFVVAIMLIFLGISNLARWAPPGPRLVPAVLRRVLAGFQWWEYVGIPGHSHEHGHKAAQHHHHFSPDEQMRKHVHEHPHEPDFAWPRSNVLRSFVVGLVHGLAGSAALALLVLATVPSLKVGVVYLLIFGIGTMTGMLFLSSLMEASMVWVVRRYQIETALSSGAGMLSLFFGLYLAYHIGFVEKLFMGG